MKVVTFRKLVWDFYENQGRDDLPWRKTQDPYAIYISEMMLQQTQTARVIEKYESWLDHFPTFEAAAETNTKEILKQWQGLGYNRRALYIKETCKTVVEKYDGTLPRAESELLSLPGIGPYTAGAIQAFAHNLPVVFVETNIRSVFIHHFFAEEEDVSDERIKERVHGTLPEKKIRDWYWALMDYGNWLKREVGNLNRRAKSYQRQSKFAGSNRQLRSLLTQFILAHEPVKRAHLQAEFAELVSTHERMKPIEVNLKELKKEGFLIEEAKLIKTSH
jgi:A/G-specific adenine glycosylase